MSLQINGSTQVIQTSIWVNDIPLETLTGIFSLLDPEDLQKCCRVCQSWQSVANDSHFYLAFIAQVNLFCRPEGKAHFEADPKSSFLKHYLELRAEPRPAGITPFTAVQRHCERLKTWNQTLPSQEDFAGDNRLAVLRAFPFDAKLGVLTTFINDGSFAFDPPQTNRLLCLCSFWGNIDMVHRLLTLFRPQIQDEEQWQLMLKALVIMAVEGRKPALAQHLKHSWDADPRETILSNFNRDDFDVGGVYADMAILLQN